MQATPIHIEEAKAFVARYNRHSLPTVGSKFTVVAIRRGELAGAAAASKPVARRLDDGKAIELLWVCMDGTPN